MVSVLITGTSKGIGFEAALAFARAGHTVHATMRNPAQSPALAETAAHEKLPITVSAMDVDSDDSVRRAIIAIEKTHGPIDVLVNNAGIERSGSVEELPLAEFRAVMETNYFGVIRCVQAVAPQMRQRRSGCIINVSSVAGRISSSPLSSYMASKWALEALSEALAGEMKMFNVRVAIV
jgi:NAD(P)-dependent dehydrogenase (short-subunit alcohol dehydrogenase family)